MQLYYKDHLHLTENGNIKFFKLIIETLQDVLSPPSSSHLSSSCLSQLSLVISPPLSSLPRSNLPSLETFSNHLHLIHCQPQQHPSTRNFKIFCLILFTAPPNFQTLSASPPFLQVFSSPLKTTFNHMSFTKPTKLITSPTFVSSSSETLQSSQLKFHPSFNIPHPLLYILTSPCTPTFLFSPTPTAHPSFSAPLPASHHHLVPHPPSKALPATPGSSFFSSFLSFVFFAQHITEETQASPPVVHHVVCGSIPLDLLAKATTK